MNKINKNQGGKRPGAGRKPLGTEKREIKIQCRITKTANKKLSIAATKFGISKSSYINNWAEKLH
jgi:hypothetical protein